MLYVEATTHVRYASCTFQFRKLKINRFYKANPFSEDSILIIITEISTSGAGTAHNKDIKPNHLPH